MQNYVGHTYLLLYMNSLFLVLTPLLKFYLVYSSILQLKNNWLI